MRARADQAIWRRSRTPSSSRTFWCALTRRKGGACGRHGERRGRRVFSAAGQCNPIRAISRRRSAPFRRPRRRVACRTAGRRSLVDADGLCSRGCRIARVPGHLAVGNFVTSFEWTSPLSGRDGRRSILDFDGDGGVPFATMSPSLARAAESPRGPVPCRGRNGFGAAVVPSHEEQPPPVCCTQFL